MKKKILSFCMMLILVSLVSCSEMTEPVKPAVVEEGLNNETFIIAVLPQQNVFEQKKKYRPLARYLSHAIGMNVKTKLLDSYESVYSELSQNRVDAAIVGSLSFVVIDSKIAIEPVARPVSKDNISTYRGSVIVRKDSGITDDVGSWKGKRIALVSKSTTAGYIFPRWYLYTNGVKNFEDYFSEIYFTGSHDAAVLKVAKGDADIASASDIIVEEVFRDNPSFREELKVIANSVPVPNNTIAVLAQCDKTVKDRLKKALLNMDKSPEGREVLFLLEKSRYIKTDKSDFSPILEMLSTLGLKTDFFTLGEIGKGVSLDLIDK